MTIDNLKLPEAIFAQHLVCLGKTGSGKSSVLRLLVEHLLDRQKRVCIVDPKGDWWGLKTSADGKGPGYPVVAFGDFKNERAGDVPINDRSGKHVAELIAAGNRPAVVGLRGWTQGAMTRFWVEFAQTLFALNSGELFLVGDEFHNFAPKQFKGKSENDTQVGIGLHWANRLLSEGRGIGLVCLIASQRPQKVHNDTLTSCETLLAMRVVHAADRAAIKLWIDGNGDPAVGKDVLASLAGMARGEAWVWSPEAGFGPQRIAFPLFSTFDSFAPPQLQKKVSAKGWADVDLDEVNEKLKAVIEEEAANDPKELKKEIARLKKEAWSSAGKAGSKRALDQAFAAADLEKAVAKAVAERDKHWRHQIKLQMGVAHTLRKRMAEVHRVSKPDAHIVEPAVIPPEEGTQARWPDNDRIASTAPRRAVARSESAGGEAALGDEKLTKAQTQILRALYWLRDEQATPAKVGFYSDYTHSGGSFTNALGRLRSLGLVEGWKITSAGEAVIAAGGDVEEKPSGPELREWLRPKLGRAENEILDVLIAAGGEPLQDAEIGERAGREHTGGSFTNALGRLRTLEAAIGYQRSGGTRAAEVFFE